MTGTPLSAAAFVERLYAAAANAGLLQGCIRLVEPSIDGSPATDSSAHASPDAWVAFIEPDETLLDGLAVATNPSIRFPAGSLAGLKKGELLEVDGIRYRVRDVRPIGDGSEKRAHLSRASEFNTAAAAN